MVCVCVCGGGGGGGGGMSKDAGMIIRKSTVV